MKKLLKTTSATLLAGVMALAPMAATADPWANQAGSELSFLPEGQVSAGVAGEVQGQIPPLVWGIAIAVVRYGLPLAVGMHRTAQSGFNGAVLLDAIDQLGG